MVKPSYGSKWYPQEAPDGERVPVMDLGSFDVENWHTECEGVQIVLKGGEALLWCPVCRVLANLEAVSTRIGHEKGKKAKPANWRNPNA